MKIRAERDGDLNFIREIKLKSLAAGEEGDLAKRIRRSEFFLPSLSLVAVMNGRPAGHILFSIISIAQQGRVFPALSLACLAVLPEYQGRGIGGTLIRKGLKESACAGYGAVIVIGSPGYYSRFGFKPAGNFGLDTGWVTPWETFMAIELEENFLGTAGGTVIYPSLFDRAV